MSKVILPGSKIGILGGGQLGRMLAIEAKKMGYRIHIFEPTLDSPASQVADKTYNASYDDIESIRAFAQGVDAVTYEFENIPLQAIQEISKTTRCRPSDKALYISQNRMREKHFLKSLGIPIAEFHVVKNLEAFKAAVDTLKPPCILKTIDFGYDGKGQQTISSTENLEQLWENHPSPTALVEKKIHFNNEFSLLIARGENALHSFFPIGCNIHKNHILDHCIIPASFPPSIIKQAQDIAITIAQELGLVGLLAIEFFYVNESKILVNEMAPRPHNSIHYSIDACPTSQFEQQLRTLCSLPLGKTTLNLPSIMRNLLGNLWINSQPPDWNRLLSLPYLKFHLYGKDQPKMNRKMGHYTISAPTLEKAISIDSQAQKILKSID